MHDIVLLLQRHRKSSRGTPRLRPLPMSLHGALRLAQPCDVGSDSFSSVLIAGRDASGDTEFQLPPSDGFLCLCCGIRSQ